MEISDNIAFNEIDDLANRTVLDGPGCSSLKDGLDGPESQGFTSAIDGLEVGTLKVSHT